MNQETILTKIAEALVEMEEETVVELCEEALKKQVPAKQIIEGGLIRGMDQVGKLFEEDEYFLPEVLICSDAMYDGIQVVKPHLKSIDSENKIKIVVGVVEGDTHDIGKNLVKIMVECGGFDVIDLGRDVPLDAFVETAVSQDCDVICMSTLMTTTMDGMRRVIENLMIGTYVRMLKSLLEADLFLRNMLMRLERIYTLGMHRNVFASYVSFSTKGVDI